MNRPTGTPSPSKPRRRRPRSLAKALTQLAAKAKASPSLALACDDETMPPKIARVLGPYRNGEKWRLVVFEENGRKAILAATRDEAEKVKAGLLRMFEDRSLLTIDAAIEEWLTHKLQTGIKPISATVIRRRLRPFLPLDATLGTLTPQAAAKLYLDETKRQGRLGVVRPATHHKTLSFAKELFAWAIERGYLRDNPFAKVKRLGKASAGKLQLREDEAKRLNAVLIKAAERDSVALALLVQLVMGMRSGEVLGLRVRDLDADATVLVIEGGKTQNARRRLEIKSAPLRQLLRRQCASLALDALIISNDRSQPYHTNRLQTALAGYCKQAGVLKVCPHSLRGLHSSLAVARGASSQFVAEALGHGSDAITRKHYISTEALDRARVARVAEALESKPDVPDLQSLETMLRRLAPDQLATLLSSVGKDR